jgi:hypothetical protein
MQIGLTILGRFVAWLSCSDSTKFGEKHHLYIVQGRHGLQTLHEMQSARMALGALRNSKAAYKYQHLLRAFPADKSQVTDRVDTTRQAHLAPPNQQKRCGSHDGVRCALLSSKESSIRVYMQVYHYRCLGIFNIFDWVQILMKLSRLYPEMQ